jgi:hypothetical protein
MRSNHWKILTALIVVMTPIHALGQGGAIQTPKKDGLFGSENPAQIAPFGPGSPPLRPVDLLRVPPPPADVRNVLRFLIPRDCPRDSHPIKLCGEATKLERQLESAMPIEINPSVMILGLRAFGPDLNGVVWWSISAEAIRETTGGAMKSEAFQLGLEKATTAYVCNIPPLATFIGSGGIVLISHTSLDFKEVGKAEVTTCAAGKRHDQM